MARLTKYEIGCAIEKLPGNMPGSASSRATLMYYFFTRSEMVDWYNRLIEERNLNLPEIS